MNNLKIKWKEPPELRGITIKLMYFYKNASINMRNPKLKLELRTLIREIEESIPSSDYALNCKNSLLKLAYLTGKILSYDEYDN